MTGYRVIGLADRSTWTIENLDDGRYFVQLINGQMGSSHCFLGDREEAIRVANALLAAVRERDEERWASAPEKGRAA